MVAIASLPVRLRQGEQTPANSIVIVVDSREAGIASRVILPTFKEAEELPRETKYVVRMEPRKFGRAARNLLKLTRPIEWPVDEPDVE